MPLPDIVHSPYAVGLVMSGAMALFMNLKNIPHKGAKHFSSWMRKKLVYTVRIYQYDELFYILEAHLFDNHQKQYKDVEASLEWSTAFDRMVSRVRLPGVPIDQVEQSSIRKVFYKQEDNVFVIQYKGKRIVIQKESEKQEKAESAKERMFRKYQLTGYRCKKEINEFLDEILQKHDAAKPKEMIKILIGTSYGEWRLFDDLHVKPLNKVFLPKGTVDMLDRDTREFCAAEDWYSSVGIPYKRGYCFYGPPGNGKTTLSLALACHLNRNVHILNINAMDDDDSLQRCFSDLKRNSVLLIEDIDRSFVQREGVQKKISFSVLLNCLDGALSKHGVIVIITTNHIEQLDPALLRDGRVDMKISIDNPDNQNIADYLSLFYQLPLSLGDNIPENERLCMASVQEICVHNREDYKNAVREITSRINEINLAV